MASFCLHLTDSATNNMANTTYTEIYDLFMNLQNDYRLLALYNNDVANSTNNLDILLQGWLLLGIGDFVNVCNQDLTDRNDTTATFNFVMSTINQTILSKFMVKYWMRKEISDILQMRNKVQDSFHTYSEAQSLTAKSALLTKIEEELSQDVVEYGYADRDMWQFWITNGFTSLQ